MKFGEMIDSVLATLAGFTQDVTAAGTLLADITATSTDMQIDFGQGAGAARPGGASGLLEIDRELIEVTSYDPQTMTARCAGWGRGARSTTAVIHRAGAKVTVRPRYPRKLVGDAINQVVAGSCPPLWPTRDLDPIDVTTIGEVGYTLPDDTVRVLRVEVAEGFGPFETRGLIKNWTVRQRHGVKALQLHDRFALSYVTLNVTVVVDPGRMTDEGNDFTDKTGLSESCVDLVQFGALARLVLSGEAVRLTALPPDASQRAEKIPTGSGTALSRYYQALYTQRLDQELTRLQQTYPIQLLRRG